jgi:hypothetical protein
VWVVTWPFSLSAAATTTPLILALFPTRNSGLGYNNAAHSILHRVSDMNRSGIESWREFRVKPCTNPPSYDTSSVTVSCINSCSPPVSVSLSLVWSVTARAAFTSRYQIFVSNLPTSRSLHNGRLIRRVSTLKRPDSGDVLKICKHFFSLLRFTCVLQEFKTRLNFRLPHGPPLVHTNWWSCRSVLIFLIKLGMLCDWYFSTIRPYLYSSLPENPLKLGRFISDALYNKNVWYNIS